ncbi:hypothetical protein [Halocynthiibacter sp.]|uniref:hypothetical protein n=1 Tax=Halocynthiibacter sp. TaxID=1979210 RepID=UPI003C5210D6
MSDPTQEINEEDHGLKGAEIAALEQRISAAFDRINGALGGLGNGDDTELAELTSALEDERKRNAQLEERLKVLNERQEGAMQELEERVIGFGKRSADQQRELASLHEVCDKLRENNSMLREANASGLADAGLVNGGLQAEIDMLRAQQAADRAELDAILEELRPAIATAQTTGETGEDAVPAATSDAAASEETV